jgi:hypothetical protein
MPDEQPLRVEMDRGDEPVFVATKIEHVELLLIRTHVVDAAERPFEFRKISEGSLAGSFEPAFQGCFRVAVSSPEVGQRLP